MIQVDIADLIEEAKDDRKPEYLTFRATRELKRKYGRVGQLLGKDKAAEALRRAATAVLDQALQEAETKRVNKPA